MKKRMVQFTIKNPLRFQREVTFVMHGNPSRSEQEWHVLVGCASARLNLLVDVIRSIHNQHVPVSPGVLTLYNKITGQNEGINHTNARTVALSVLRRATREGVWGIEWAIKEVKGWS